MQKIAGINIYPFDTPFEQFQILITTIPIVDKPAKALLEEYEYAKYGHLSPDMNKAHKAARIIQKELIVFKFKNLFFLPILIKLHYKNRR